MITVENIKEEIRGRISKYDAQAQELIEKGTCESSEEARSYLSAANVLRALLFWITDKK